MSEIRAVLGTTVIIYGSGGQGAYIATQSVLQEYGLCGYPKWDGVNWHFLYLSELEPDTVLRKLSGLVTAQSRNNQTVSNNHQTSLTNMNRRKSCNE